MEGLGCGWRRCRGGDDDIMVWREFEEGGRGYMMIMKMIRGMVEDDGSCEVFFNEDGDDKKMKD